MPNAPRWPSQPDLARGPEAIVAFQYCEQGGDSTDTSIADGAFSMATYSVSWKSRHELVYAEDGRTLRVEVEDGYDRPITEPMGRQHAKLWHLVVYEESIKHWDDGRLVAQGERDRIARNISVALTTAGTKHVIA